MDFYYTPISAPCRSVLMAAKTIGIELTKHNLNLFAGEHKQPQFLQINPQHTVPTLVDHGFVLWESRPILIYLVEQYAKTDSLYPKDPQVRAQINQRLYFDMGTLFNAFGEYYLPQIFTKSPPDPEKYKNMEAAFQLLNTMLERRQFAIGKSLTLADIAWLASVSTFDACGFNFSKYTHVVSWYENVKRVQPGWQENWEGCLGFKQIFNK